MNYSFFFNNRTRVNKAYTLLEVVVVLALISTISIIILPYSITDLRSINASSTASDLSSQIFTAQQNAFSGKNNSSFGIAFYTNSYIIFQGDSLATSTSTETINLPSNIRLSLINFSSGGSELLFAKGSVKPDTDGLIRVTDSSVSYQININKEGYISFDRI